jgi:FtsP/CotA-like multicopper oxidase with cupredoxin domain
LALACGARCGGHPPGHGGHDGYHDLPPALPMLKPEPHEGLPALLPATDLNPDPAIVEVDLRATVGEVEYLTGTRSAVWGYGGSVPGPLIEARRGDRLIVHFRNDLPEETTIHWHGVRVPNAMDGAGHLTQPVLPGGTFDYEFVLPDAGLYWFHPHVRSDEQVERGLYGALVVRDESDAIIPAASERIVVLDDALIDPATGALDLEINPRAAMMGREGNLVLLNGKPSNAVVAFRAGERLRLRLLNAANARYFGIALEGGELVQIGADGGLLAGPRTISGALLLIPGERADLLVTIAEPNTTAMLRAVSYERAAGAGLTEPVDLIRFTTGADPAAAPAALPAVLRDLPELAATEGAAEQEIRLGERVVQDKWQFTINEAAFPRVPEIRGDQGTIQRWVVKNDTEMDHPFHIHGFFFQAVGGILARKDTINVPGHHMVELLVDLAPRDGAAGHWMYHCHIFEHAEGGMMGALMVR